MLQFAREVRDSLRRAGGFDVILTRDGDHFVSLERRVSLAHDAGADVFISLHADALQQGHARGATVYTLSDEASDAASAILAERHDRDDILAGIDLSGTDDEVADVLLDLARLETRPRTALLATTHSPVGGKFDLFNALSEWRLEQETASCGRVFGFEGCGYSVCPDRSGFFVVSTGSCQSSGPKLACGDGGGHS